MPRGLASRAALRRLAARRESLDEGLAAGEPGASKGAKRWLPGGAKSLKEKVPRQFSKLRLDSICVFVCF